MKFARDLQLFPKSVQSLIRKTTHPEVHTPLYDMTEAFQHTLCLPPDGSALVTHLITHIQRGNAAVTSGTRHGSSHHRNKDSNVRIAPPRHFTLKTAQIQLPVSSPMGKNNAITLPRLILIWSWSCWYCQVLQELFLGRHSHLSLHYREPVTNQRTILPRSNAGNQWVH